jgi:hypothetical protein
VAFVADAAGFETFTDTRPAVSEGAVTVKDVAVWAVIFATVPPNVTVATVPRLVPVIETDVVCVAFPAFGVRLVIVGTV